MTRAGIPRSEVCANLDCYCLRKMSLMEDSPEDDIENDGDYEADDIDVLFSSGISM